MTLLYKGLDIMEWTKDLLDNPKSQGAIDDHIDTINSNFPINLIAIAIPMNTNAQAMAARGSNFVIDPATYSARFMNKIHAVGKNVLFRGTDCAFEGIYSFAKVNHRNGHRYSFFGDNITDNFTAGTRNHGYGRTSATGNLSTNYL